ncbi:uncharacterized protein [Triticum aestivum]|uniref:uncharacterized protein n=1 Tax=Triticum aestivum TaxID=4565 RepID=UPI001D0185EB|nr:uncharacterized protein LOC123156655 [Triticum aestivum]
MRWRWLSEDEIRFFPPSHRSSGASSVIGERVEFSEAPTSQAQPTVHRSASPFLLLAGRAAAAPSTSAAAQASASLPPSASGSPPPTTAGDGVGKKKLSELLRRMRAVRLREAGVDVRFCPSVDGMHLSTQGFRRARKQNSAA